MTARDLFLNFIFLRSEPIHTRIVCFLLDLRVILSMIFIYTGGNFPNIFKISAKMMNLPYFLCCLNWLFTHAWARVLII